MIDNEFIHRVMGEEFQKLVLEHQKECNRRSNKWQRDNPHLQRECINKYYRTEKGLYSASLRNYRRQIKFEQACEDLSWEEKKMIGEFYKNCPLGYEVDHIVPVSKGGKHKLSNLQYLTMKENRSKSDNLNWKN